MEVIQRLQALDYVLVIVWAVIIAWGVSTGVIRQAIVAVALYVGAITAGQAYQFLGGLLALASGPESMPRAQLVAYVLLLFAVMTLVALVASRLYPSTRLARRQSRLDAILGGVVAGFWGILLLISIVTILAFFTVIQWPAQESTQTAVNGQVQRSQVALLLRGPLSPVWSLMEPWLPEPLRQPRQPQDAPTTRQR